MELKSECEKCGAPLAHNGIAYICSYECTYCATCTQAMDHVCPKCEGEPVRRPRRKRCLVPAAGLMFDSIREKAFVAEDVSV